MRVRLCAVLCGLTSLFASDLEARADDLGNDTVITITKSWTQEPGGWNYPIAILVPDGAPPAGGFPTCILLHGNGGNGPGMIPGFAKLLDDHVLIAPSGYQNSWNICRENSKAPDVKMVTELVDRLRDFDNLNGAAIRILGFSNGASLANRVFMEDDDESIDTICAVVSQLSDTMARGGNYYRPTTAPDPKSPFCGFNTEVVPANGRRYLGISNENDNIIPYEGGWSPVGIAFLDSRVAAYEVARSQGYVGEANLGDGVEIGDSDVFKYDYLDDRVVHLRGFAVHGMNETQRAFLGDFLSDWPLPEVDSDLNDDDRVDGGDLGLLMAGWGGPSPDLDGDGTVGGGDLGRLLADWTSEP